MAKLFLKKRKKDNKRKSSLLCSEVRNLKRIILQLKIFLKILIMLHNYN